MAKTLGAKHTCFHCDKKFYDFGKTEVICPSCGADQATGVAPTVEEEPEPKSEILEDELDEDLETDSLDDEAEDDEAGDEDDFGDDGGAALDDLEENDDLDDEDEFGDDGVDDY